MNFIPRKVEGAWYGGGRAGLAEARMLHVRG